MNRTALLSVAGALAGAISMAQAMGPGRLSLDHLLARRLAHLEQLQPD
jgi:hypothetical protein